MCNLEGGQEWEFLVNQYMYKWWKEMERKDLVEIEVGEVQIGFWTIRLII